MPLVRIELISKRRWWVLPLATCAAYVFAIARQDKFPDKFVEWVAVHGFKIEAANE